LSKIPPHLLKDEDPIFEFNKAIIEATNDIAIAYKPNLAFYERLGSDGWKSLEKIVDFIKSKHNEIFLIADAKRGDIGNTSGMYAKAFFERMNFDAVTVAPYMGKDSVSPFLQFKDKWIILLAATSNPGASDFQFIKDNIDEALYKRVIRTSSMWGNINNIMYVVGATKAELLADIRKIIPHHFLLIPGIGAQGGSLKEVVKYGMNEQCGLIVNSSRSIIYASNSENFADAAREQARIIQSEMEISLT
jgi:orotidine-5'-phosphate decarboxylase